MNGDPAQGQGLSVPMNTSAALQPAGRHWGVVTYMSAS